jgi:photosystem II stability/assembly factor-like uncharacterized protein
MANHTRIYLPVLLGFFPLFLAAQGLDLSNIKNLKIRNVGPANMSGRITAIDAATDNPRIVVAGTASGGVWKSENGGSAWQPVFDDQPTQNIGAVRIDPTNSKVIWVGTGEGNPRNSMNLGMGIFKSTDGGKTWKHHGLEATRTIHRILIDPTAPQTVYAGAMGDPFAPGPDRGLYKSGDGGLTWKRILHTNDSSGVADMAMDPEDPAKIFVAMYEHRRTPYSFTSGGPGSGLFVTYDGGSTWTKLGAESGLPDGHLGRIGIAIAPGNPRRVYAKVEAAKNALYRSEDGGKTWKIINNNPKYVNNRPFYFQELAVDSKDPDRLYNIYQALTISRDGGLTFDSIPMIPADETKGIHADFHAFWVNPSDPLHFIIGGDGGLGITYDHGKSWYFPENIPVAQFYHVNADEDTPFNVYGGMQDNGNWSGPAYTWKRGGIRTLYWQYLVGGDGFDIAPDLDNSRFGYGSSQNGYLYRYDKTTGYYVSVRPPAPHPDTRLRFNWNAGFAKDPWDADAVYYGSQFLHLSRDKGATWSIISPDLSSNNPNHQKGDYGGLTLDVSGAEAYNTILSIAPSPLDRQLIWVGTDDGQVQMTADGGHTWTNLSDKVKGMPKEAWITQIHASRYHAGTVWMAVNNYRKGDYAPYLFRSTDYGQNWEQLADASKVRGYTLCVVQDPAEPSLVFLGTEHGLWISTDTGSTWQQFKNGFPAVSTMDMVVQEKESALVIGTFGRAIWVLDDLRSLREIAAGRLNAAITALPMNDAVQVKGLFIAPPGNIWTGFHTTFEGENRIFQKTAIPFYLRQAPEAMHKVIATIYDEKQSPIRRLEQDALQQGLNYLIWELDEAGAALPPALTNGETRGIPVLPGKYTILLEYLSFKDTTFVTVVPDPRFDRSPEVDKALYTLQKAANQQAGRLSQILQQLDQRIALSEKLEKYYSGMEGKSAKNNLQMATEMKIHLQTLRAEGQAKPLGRQVGAWQSTENTPFAQIEAILMMTAARTTLPSPQHFERLGQAESAVSAFGQKVDTFLNTTWKPFELRFGKSHDFNFISPPPAAK